MFSRKESYLFEFTSMPDLNSGTWRRVGNMNEDKCCFASGVIDLMDGRTVMIAAGGRINDDFSNMVLVYFVYYNCSGWYKRGWVLT